MYKLTRIINHRIEYSENWTRHSLCLSHSSFFLSDEEYDILLNLSYENEYDYTQDDDIIKLDKSPRILEDNNLSSDFIEDYSKHLNAKFFISYLVKSDVDETDNK